MNQGFGSRRAASSAPASPAHATAARPLLPRSLHMHALALPFVAGAPKWKYGNWMPWWRPAEDQLQQLEPPDGEGKRLD